MVLLSLGIVQILATLPTPPAFDEPPTLRSPVYLTLDSVVMEDPRPFGYNYQWYTRAYGTEEPSPVYAPSIPGPTIRVRPGEQLVMRVRNNLGANFEQHSFSDPCTDQFCDVNTTNLHTHGLHVSPRCEEGEDCQDDIFVHILPGGEQLYNFSLPANHMAGTHWYHPHNHHSTASQAGGGAHGMLIVDDPFGSLPEQYARMAEKQLVITCIDLRSPTFSGDVEAQGEIEELSSGDLWKFFGATMGGDGEYVALGPGAVIALVNGLYIPEMDIEDAQWNRFRLLYAATRLTLSLRPISDDAYCELQLLAKDGVYLHEMPRTIDTVYLASGNRADVAIRCRCLSEPPCRVSIESSPQWTSPCRDDSMVDPNCDNPLGSVGQPTFNQTLLFMSVRAGSYHVLGPLEPVRVKRPCYLADLRHVHVADNNRGRVVFWEPPAYMVTWSSKTRGENFSGQPMLIEDTAPELHTMNVGEVQQFYFRGPDGEGGGIAIHPFHLHVSPYQIVSLYSEDPYFQVGDWHDTLLHSSAQAMVKLQTSDFTGNYVVHCHILAHEDGGMLAYFDVDGAEGATCLTAGACENCYRSDVGTAGAGYELVETRNRREQIQLVANVSKCLKVDPSNTSVSVGDCSPVSESADDLFSIHVGDGVIRWAQDTTRCLSAQQSSERSDSLNSLLLVQCYMGLDLLFNVPNRNQGQIRYVRQPDWCLHASISSGLSIGQCQGTPRQSLFWLRFETVEAVWVGGNPGENCHEVCADRDGCVGRWPTSLDGEQFILQQLAKKRKIQANEAPHNPSFVDSTCEIIVPNVSGPAARCAWEPPLETSQCCPCGSEGVPTPEKRSKPPTRRFRGGPSAA